MGKKITVVVSCCETTQTKENCFYIFWFVWIVYWFCNESHRNTREKTKAKTFSEILWRFIMLWKGISAQIHCPILIRGSWLQPSLSACISHQWI